jgi:NADH:ubiquinone oxidoreductase subunit 6 (subunit J)
MENTLINIGIYVTYVLIFVSLLALLFFSLKFILTNIKKSKAALVGVVALVIIFAISYLISPVDDVRAEIWEKTATDPGLSKMIGSGLYITYFCFIGVIGVTIYAAISKFVK